MLQTSLSSINAQVVDTPSIQEKLHGAARSDSIAVCHRSDLQRSSISEQKVLQIVRERTARSKHFPADLFADPAWDILLDLFAAKLGQRRLSVSAACVGAGVPATTALRWLTTLEHKGLVKRSPDPLDARRVFVDLSDVATAGMHAYFNYVEG